MSGSRKPPSMIVAWFNGAQLLKAGTDQAVLDSEIAETPIGRHGRLFYTQLDNKSAKLECVDGSDKLTYELILEVGEYRLATAEGGRVLTNAEKRCLSTAQQREAQIKESKDAFQRKAINMGVKAYAAAEKLRRRRGETFVATCNLEAVPLWRHNGKLEHERIDGVARVTITGATWATLPENGLCVVWEDEHGLFFPPSELHQALGINALAARGRANSRRP